MALMLMLFWLILNGRADADVWITGGIAAVFMMLFSYKFGGWTPRKELNAVRLLPSACMYALCLLTEIVKANLAVLRLIFSGQTHPYIRSFQTPLRTGAARVALANSITLTPGTVTIQLVDDRLTVHCLSREMAEGLTDSILEKRLMKMEAKMLGKRV